MEATQEPIKVFLVCVTQLFEKSRNPWVVKVDRIIDVKFDKAFFKVNGHQQCVNLGQIFFVDYLKQSLGKNQGDITILLGHLTDNFKILSWKMLD